jgi:hypothetical protein
MAEFHYGIGLREHTDRYLPSPESNLGFNPSLMVDSLVLMLQGGGRRLEDLRELKQEEGLLRTTKVMQWNPHRSILCLWAFRGGRVLHYLCCFL